MKNKGEKIFDGCDVKVVEITDYVFDDSPVEVETGEFIVPKDGIGTAAKHKTSNDDKPGKQYAGSEAILHCPLTEDDRVEVTSSFANYDGRLKAFDSLRKNAGALICRNCRYSRMTPIEIAKERTKLAHVEAEQLEAITARRKALSELQEADPDFKLYE